MKLTIITINYNNKTGLEKTILSVRNQVFKDYEYIVIDGKSTDGSTDLLKMHEDKITYWQSEPDTGIYNAMNKGIEKAQGEYLLFLNSGDWLLNESNLNNFMQVIDSYDIAYGDQYIHYADGNVLHDKYSDTLIYSNFAYRGGLPHQATIIKRAAIKKYGCYDENFRMVSDWKFFIIAIFKWHLSYKHIPIVLSCYSWGGFSSNPINDSIQLEERQRVLKEHFPNFLYVKDQMDRCNQLVFTFQHSKFIKLLRFFKLV